MAQSPFDFQWLLNLEHPNVSQNIYYWKDQFHCQLEQNLIFLSANSMEQCPTPQNTVPLETTGLVVSMSWLRTEKAHQKNCANAEKPPSWGKHWYWSSAPEIAVLQWWAELQYFYIHTYNLLNSVIQLGLISLYLEISVFVDRRCWRKIKWLIFNSHYYAFRL